MRPPGALEKHRLSEDTSHLRARKHLASRVEHEEFRIFSTERRWSSLPASCRHLRWFLSRIFNLPCRMG